MLEAIALTKPPKPIIEDYYTTLITSITLHSDPFSNDGAGAVVDKQDDIDQFLHPQGRYYGSFTPERLAFNANLQEFASRISLICGLETGGKISPDEAYREIKTLWKQLKKSKAEFLDAEKRPKPELPPEE